MFDLTDDDLDDEILPTEPVDEDDDEDEEEEIADDDEVDEKDS